MFFLILGSVSIIMAIFSLGIYIRILKNSECAMGKITDIDYGDSYCRGGTAYFIEVEFHKDGQDIKLDTLNYFFLAPFFEKHKLSRLRKKHIGRPVHIYYNPDNKRQVLLREYMWKNFLICAFILFLGVVILIFNCDY